MKYFKWEKIEKETRDHWLEVKGDDGSLAFKDVVDKKGRPIYPYHAIAKWDGCIIFEDYSNGYGYGHQHDESCDAGNGCCEQSVHICDIDSMIDMLQKLKEKAKEHFGKDWPNQ